IQDLIVSSPGHLTILFPARQRYSPPISNRRGTQPIIETIIGRILERQRQISQLTLPRGLSPIPKKPILFQTGLFLTAEVTLAASREPGLWTSISDVQNRNCFAAYRLSIG